MLISTNDTYKNLDDLKKAIIEYIDTQPHNYDHNTYKKLYSATCIGYKDFGCDAIVQCILRKKDNLWVIKKIRTQHKCPSEIHVLGIGNYMYKQIKEYTKRIGLNTSSFSYNAVHKAYKKYKEINNLNSDGPLFVNDTFQIQNMSTNCMQAFVNEFEYLNEGVKIDYTDNYVFFMFENLMKYTRNVLELKVYERLDGHVVYGLLFDPHDSPVIYCFSVSDDMALTENLSRLIKNIDTDYFNIIIDYKKELIDSLEFLNVNYLIKSRSVCREVFKNNRDHLVIDKLFGICNGHIKRAKGEDKRKRRKKSDSSVYKKNIEDVPFFVSENDSDYILSCEEFDSITNLINFYNLSEERYIARYNYFGLNNLCETEVECVNYSLYQASFYECINGIIASIKLPEMTETYGPNVFLRLEKNKQLKFDVDYTNKDSLKFVVTDGKEYTVDFNALTCDCGKFQSYLIPCVHACSVDIDLFKYISILYNKEHFLFEYNLTPVFENQQCNKSKIATKPKRKRARKAEDEKENVAN